MKKTVKLLGIILLILPSINQAHAATISPMQEYKIDLDKSKAYFGDSEVIGADMSTFTLLNNNGYAKDKYHVYFKGEILENADPKTFVILSTDRTRVNRNDYHVISYGYSKDKNNQRC